MRKDPLTAPLNAYPGILIVDDHRAVREALVQLLEEHQLSVCAQTDRVADALASVARRKPDLALVDLSLDDSLRLVTALHEQGIPVVICSSEERPEYVRKALQAGARAYLAKRDVGQLLVRTIHDVLQGWVFISPHAAKE